LETTDDHSGALIVRACGEVTHRWSWRHCLGRCTRLWRLPSDGGRGWRQRCRRGGGGQGPV